MKREEILALCASNPEIIVSYIESLEFQIKELSEKLQALEARLNQNGRNSSKSPSTIFPLKKNPIPGVAVKRVARNLEVKKVIQDRLSILLMILIRYSSIL
jgi:hypothetical protein